MCLLHRFSEGSLAWLRDLLALFGGIYLIIHPIFHLGFNGYTFVASMLNLGAMVLAVIFYFLYIGILRGKRCMARRTFLVLTLVYMVVIGITFWFFIHPMTYGMATNLSK
jgi:hypothetical protein